MSFPMSSVPAIIQPVYPAAALSVRGKKKSRGGIIIMMMIKNCNKKQCVCVFPLTCFLLAVFSGLPVFAKIILEVTDRFFFLNFPRISNRSAEPLDGIQNGAGGRRGGEKPRN